MTVFPHWTVEELKEESTKAVKHFIDDRLSEPSRKYEELLSDCECQVRKLFDVSDNLRRLNAKVFVNHPSLLEAARFLTGPPISQDDLKTLAGVKPPRAGVTEDLAEQVARVILQAIDQKRFPWLAENRPAKPSERSCAMLWSAGVWAVERIRTWRRGEASKKQETLVAEALTKAGYEKREILGGRNIGPGGIDRIRRGTFTGELKLDGRKCDLPVRLRDGRLLAIECKVSNSEVNSIKRLVREVGGKADAWRNTFGAGVVTAAVLSGVFGVSTSLVVAQEAHGVYLFWQHDLAHLVLTLAPK